MNETKPTTKKAPEIPDLLSEKFLADLMSMGEASSDALNDIAKVVLDQKDKVKQASEAEKAAKANLKAAESVLISAMLENGLDRMTAHGKTFSQKEKENPRVRKEDQEKLLKWLRETKRESLIEETVPKRTLSALIIDEFLAVDEAPPDFVIVDRYRKLSITKAAR